MRITGIVSNIREEEIEYKGETPISLPKLIDGIYLTLYTGMGNGFKDFRFPRKMSEAEKNIIGSRNINYSEDTSSFSGEGLHIVIFHYKIEILEGPNKGRILEAEVSKG